QPPTSDNGTGPVFPLAYGQQALWFIHQTAPESAAYTIGWAARIAGTLDRGRLQNAVQQLVDRHPALRTTIVTRDGVPFQHISEPLLVDFVAIDAQDASWEVILARLDDAFHTPFDLEHGPVFRVRLLVRSAQEHVLLLAVHHIVADFWSLLVLVD